MLDSIADKELAAVQAHPVGVTALAICKATQVAITAGGDSRIRFWSWSDGAVQPTGRRVIAHDHRILSLAVSPDGRRVAIVDEAARLAVYDVKSGEEVFRTELTGNGKPLTGRVAFNRDGTRLAAFGPGQSCLLFVVTNRLRLGPHLA